MAEGRYRLEDVFNEARYPELTFVQPREYRHIKSSFRAEGKHITLSGPSGCGKTTLVHALLRDLGLQLSDVLMLNGRSYSGIESILEVFGKDLGAEPTLEAVTALLQLVKFVIVDDFHHLSRSARLELARYLKLWHENRVRFVIVGIASSANELMGADAELGIRNDPFELGTQDEGFTLSLIGLGERALNLQFADVFKTQIVAGCNGVPSIVHVICRTACVEAGVEATVEGPARIVDFRLQNLRDAVLRIFDAKYFEKVVGLAKGKQQARSVHNTYFDIVERIAKDGRSEIPVEYLFSEIVGKITDTKARSRKATSFYNCLHNLDDVINSKGLSDVLLYSKGAKYIAIDDPSFRFYLNMLDMESVRSKVHIREEKFTYDVAVSFAGEVRSTVIQFVEAAKQRGLAVFYDFDQQAQLWGQDLRRRLAEVYANEALYMVVFLSETYPERDWSSFELAVGKDAEKKRTAEYLLPIRVDDVHVVGLNETRGYLDLRRMTVEQIADILVEKVELSAAHTG